MTAMQVSQIGKQVGLWPRRLGAAVTKERAAHQQQVDVPRSRAPENDYLIVAVLALVPSSGAQHQLLEGSEGRGEEVEALACVPSSGA
jgi:hypothetical protein